MQQRFLSKILESPILGVMAFGAGLGFFFLPIVFSTTEKAAEFWGSFLAAITGAAALLAGAWYQDRLSRRQSFENTKQETLTEALQLYLWLGWCKQDTSARSNVAA